MGQRPSVSTSVEIRLTSPAGRRGGRRRRNPVVCSGRFGGDRTTSPAFPPSRRRRPGLRAAGAGGLRSPPAAANPPRTRTSRPAPTRSRSSTARVPDRAAPRPDLAAADRRPQHRRQDGPGADRDDLDRRQGGPDLLAALRHPRSRSRASPSPTGRSGCSPQHYPKLAGSSRAGRRRDLQPQDLRLRPAEARRDDRGGLEAERGQGRQSSRVLYRGRRRPQRQRQGRDRRRRRARRLLRGADLAASPPNTIVTDSGEVVEIPSKPKRAGPSSVPWHGTPRRCVASPPLAARAGRACRPAATAQAASRQRGRTDRPPGAPRHAGGGVALKRIGSFDHPVYVSGRARLPEAALRGRAAGQGRGAARRAQAAARPSSTSRRWSAPRRRARPALDRLPARLRAAAGASTSTTPTARATSGSTNSSGAARRGRRAARAATVIEIPHPVNANHNGGQMQFLGNLLYFGTGDGGSGGDPPNNAQNKDVLLGKLLRIDPRPSGGRPYSVPADNPFVGKPGRDEIYSYGLRNPFRFSFDTVDARAAPDRDRRRRPEPLRGARLHDRRGGARRQLRLGRLRGLRPLPRRKQRHARPRRHDEADLRLPPQPRRQLLDHRRLRGRATAACPPCTGATSTPTSARASCAASSPTCGGPAATASSASRSAPRPPSAKTTRGRIYVASLEGPVYRLVPRRLDARLQLADQPRARKGALRWRAELRRRARRRSTATAPNGDGAEQIEVHNPATGERDRHGPGRLARRASPQTVARVRANQPEWEALGIEGRYRWLGQAARLAARQPRPGARHDAGGDRQGPRRRRQRAGLPRRPDQLLRDARRRSSSARRASAPTPRCSPPRSCASSTGPIRWSGSSAPGTSR